MVNLISTTKYIICLLFTESNTAERNKYNKEQTI
jgi:hypothetical protein